MNAAEISATYREQGEALAAFFARGETLGLALGQTPQMQEAMYHVALTLYGQAKYADAMRMFAFLLTCNHLDRRYYMAFGACMQMSGQPGEAIKYYATAAQLEMTNPDAPLHSAECYLAIGERDQARTAVRFALAQARGQGEHCHLVPRLEAMLGFIDPPTTHGDEP